MPPPSSRAHRLLDVQTRERVARIDAYAATLRRDGRASPSVPLSASTDAELNRVYRLYLQQLATLPAAKRDLVAAERVWITYRDRECALEGGACLTQLERARTGDLENTWLGETFW